jgi:hypothetical protein
MFDQFNDGYCPQCLLAEKQEAMILNDHDFWECPACRLQARSSGGMFVLLRTRGEGHLKDTKATDTVMGWVLCRARKTNSLETGEDFKNESELRQFLANEVV